ncbi:hypothetical protein [Pedobacter sp.]|uniref:hypothetical protein n=1 Tax=Pedobacter sp. TaxID=1411316 RepID=UPI0031CE1FDB
MKILILLLCSILLSQFSFAQVANVGDYEVKVTSYRYKTTKGQLKKVSPEGIGIEDYQGNYIIFRTADIIKIKVRKRGLTFGKAVAGGTLLGLVAGAAIWSLDENGDATEDMLKLTAALTASGAAVGAVVGGVSEIAAGKLTLKVNGNVEYFKQNYQKLEKYLNYFEPIQHVNGG